LGIRLLSRRPLAHPIRGLPPSVDVNKTEEKGSDVNLATHLVNAARLGRFDVGVVISGDSFLLGLVHWIVTTHLTI
jgi:hypothetical protein